MLPPCLRPGLLPALVAAASVTPLRSSISCAEMCRLLRNDAQPRLLRRAVEALADAEPPPLCPLRLEFLCVHVTVCSGQCAVCQQTPPVHRAVVRRPVSDCPLPLTTHTTCRPRTTSLPCGGRLRSRIARPCPCTVPACGWRESRRRTGRPLCLSAPADHDRGRVGHRDGHARRAARG